jgi:hypothetical protein
VNRGTHTVAHFARPHLPFRAVNRSGTAEHDPALQKHHLLPRQALNKRCFTGLIETVGADRIGFDDFRCNGLLLPALHRGPHRRYNEMVIQRMGRIERRWSLQKQSRPDEAAAVALMRLALLQRALRRRLLDVRKPLRLNRKDRQAARVDFNDLDAMAGLLWEASAD